jgi:hypothetical protein
LQVYHVTRLQIALVAPDRLGKFKQVRVGLPVWFRLVLEIEAVFAGRDLWGAEAGSRLNI